MGDWRSIEELGEGRVARARLPIDDFVLDRTQRFCVMTVVAPEGTNQKSEDMVIRVYGCKETLAEANRWAKSIRDSCDMWDVYVVKTNSWAPLPPRISEIDEVQFTDARVQAVHDSYVEHQRGQKRDMMERLAQVQQDRALKRESEATAKAALQASEEFAQLVLEAGEEGGVGAANEQHGEAEISDGAEESKESA